MVQERVLALRIKEHLPNHVSELVLGHQIFSEDDLKIKLAQKLNSLGNYKIDVRSEHTLDLGSQERAKKSGKIDLLVYINRQPIFVIEIKVALSQTHGQVYVTGENRHSIEKDLCSLFDILSSKYNTANVAVMVIVGATHGGQQNEWNSTDKLDALRKKYEDKFAAAEL